MILTEFMNSRRPRFHSIKILANRRLSKINFSPKKSTLLIEQQQGIKRLQKSLDKQNQRDDPQITETYQTYLKQQNNVIENKLWSYFQKHTQYFNDKVQKERVNGWTKLMDSIIKQTQVKLQNIQHYIKNTSNSIQKKYKETHILYEEIHTAKAERRKRKQQNLQFPGFNEQQFKEKIYILQQNISQLLKEIQEKNKQLYKETEQLNKIKLQRLNFLKKLLKQGYYRENGVKWILNQMFIIKYKPQQKIDMPDFLDNFSRQCLIMEYENIQNKAQGQKQFFSNRFNNKNKSKLPPIGIRKQFHSNIEFLPKKSQLKQVYQEAKSFVQEYIKANKLKNTQQNHQFSKNAIQTRYRWKDHQRQRIKNVYSPQTRRKVYKVLFGTKLQISQ